MDFNNHLQHLFEQAEFKRQYYRQAAFARLFDQILILRKQRGLTQKDLARKADTTQAVISRLENGSVKPSLETIVNIAEALDAAVEVHLVPLEEIEPYQAPQIDCTEVEQKKKNLHQGVLLFTRTVAKTNSQESWFESENIVKSQSASSLKKSKEKVLVW